MPPVRYSLKKVFSFNLYNPIYISNDKGEAASTHLNLDNGLFTLASARWLALHESFSYPTWVATAIKHGKDHHDIVNNTVNI